MNLTEVGDIKKQWQEYTEELYNKDLNDPDNHDGVITHLEPDILECKVKWALGSITMNKASGGDAVPAELFQILTDDAVKLLHSALFMIARTWKQPGCPSADEWIRKLWYIYTTEYYSAIKKNSFESVLMRWMKLEPIIQSEVSQKDKYQYSILTHVYGIQKDGNNNPICKTEKETQMYRTDF